MVLKMFIAFGTFAITWWLMEILKWNKQIKMGPGPPPKSVLQNISFFAAAKVVRMDFTLAFLLILSAAIVLLLRHVTRNFNYWRDRNIPYMKPVPIFGSILDVALQKASIGTFLQDAYQKTDSPFLGFFVFDQPFLLVRRPDVIKAILIKDFEHFHDRSITENPSDDNIGASLLFVMKNPLWKFIRTKLTPIFSSGKAKKMLVLIQEASENLVNYLSDLPGNDKVIEVKELCERYAFDVVTSCSFGSNSRCFTCKNSGFELARQIFGTGVARAVQIGSHFFAPFLVKMLRMKLVDPKASAFLRKIIWEAVAERARSNINTGSAVDYMIKIRDEQHTSKFKLGDDGLVAQASILFTGSDLTAMLISLILYELGINLDIQSRLRTEIVAIVKIHGILSYEAIQNMTYLDMVLKETLRKYPPAVFLERRCNKDYFVPGEDTVIEKGIPVYISVLGLHRDPKYFPNPDVFDPERFSHQNRDSIPKFCYIPFGGGPRSCIGGRFVALSSKVAVASILLKFLILPTKETPVPLTLETRGVTIAAKDDLYLSFKPIATSTDETA